MSRWAPRRVALVTWLLAAACRGEPLGVARPAPPTFDATSVAANPNNVLSAVVTVRLRGADSVTVHVQRADAGGDEEVTPAVPVTVDTAVVPVFGLVAAHRYVLRAVARGAGGATVGDAVELTTDTLPSDLPRYVAGGQDPTPGYVVFSAGRYGVVIDNTGRVVWYRRFPNGPGLTFTAEPSGKYYARVPAPAPAGPSPWVELDPLGDVIRTFDCLDGLTARFHDLIAQPDGSYWLMCDETRRMDLSGIGGVPNANVTGTAIQHIAADGRLLFQWSPFDYFAITDGDPRDLAGASVNWTHGNALDLAPDGNLIVSFRNLGEITKINTSTGAVIWRLGGRRNEFALADAAGAMFVGQHSARAYAPGAILLLDNLGDSTASRAERYTLDEQRMTVRLVRAYGSLPGVIAPIGGSAQDLPNARTLVSFGPAGRVEEYDATGRVVWRIEQGAGYVFRAQRIRSLYSPGTGVTR
jgi:arylsulfotransferase ASST